MQARKGQEYRADIKHTAEVSLIRAHLFTRFPIAACEKIPSFDRARVNPFHHIVMCTRPRFLLLFLPLLLLLLSFFLLLLLLLLLSSLHVHLCASRGDTKGCSMCSACFFVLRKQRAARKWIELQEECWEQVTYSLNLSFVVRLILESVLVIEIEKICFNRFCLLFGYYIRS